MLKGENGESAELDFKTSAEAIEFFEEARDRAKECFLDVLTDEIELKEKFSRRCTTKSPIISTSV